jgi:prepilin-type N-terminal cleavage/methylation domain-containing protein
MRHKNSGFTLKQRGRRGGFTLQRLRGRLSGFTLQQPRGRYCGFTLAEMLIAIAVLTVIVLFVTRLVNSAANIVTHGKKHMDTESHVRPLFDRLAVDIAQMLKRTDVSCYLKYNGGPTDMGSGSTGANDRMAFFTAVPGYYDESNVVYNSRYCIIAYRVNTDPTSASYNKVERMAKGLPLNAAYTTPLPSTSANNKVIPLLFLAPAPGVADTGLASWVTTIDSNTYGWPAATKASPDPNYYPSDPYQKYELVGPQVFRLEYYYLTKDLSAYAGGVAPSLVAYPSGSGCANGQPCGQLSQPTTSTGSQYLDWTSANRVNIKDVAAIVVAIAAIDPQSKKLLSDAQIATLVTKFTNYTFVGTTPGWLLAQWQNKLKGITDPNSPDFDGSMPPPAIQGIRFYERYFYLNQ